MKRERKTKYVAILKDKTGRATSYREITSAAKGERIRVEHDGTVDICVATSIDHILLSYPELAKRPS